MLSTADEIRELAQLLKSEKIIGFRMLAGDLLQRSRVSTLGESLACRREDPLVVALRVGSLGAGSPIGVGSGSPSGKPG